MADRTVKVILSALPAGLVAGFAVGAKATKDFGKELDTMAVKHEGSFNKLTNMAGAVGVGLVAAFAVATKSAMEFDKQMSAVAAVSDASAKQMGQLRDAAIKAGQDTAYTATQSAEAEEELAKAGISTADILSGGLKGALSLAAAGSIDLADAATYASQAMIEFGLHGKDVGHIADVLTAGANKSVTDVKGLGEALGQTGTVAHQAGMNLDETVGVLALFSQHGLDGVEAGTTFKTMLLKLENPTEKAAGLMQSLGINMYDASGHFLSAAGVADQLQKALGGLTDAQRNQALGEIFGTRAVRGAIDLYNAGAAGVDEWTQAVNDQGIAAKTANTKLNNLAGDVKKLEGSLQALAITGSGGATAGMRFFAQGAESAVNAVSNLPKPLQEGMTLMSGFSGAAILGAVGFVKAKGAVSQFMATLTEMGPTGEKAALGLGKIGGIAGKLGLAGLAVGGLVIGFDLLSKWIDKNEGPVKRNIDDLGTSLSDLAMYGRDLNGELSKTFGKNFLGLSADIEQIQNATIALGDLKKAQAAAAKTTTGGESGRGQIYGQLQVGHLQNSMAQQKSDVSALDSALAQMATNGGAAQATIAFQDLASAQGWTDLQTKQALALMPKYSAAMQGAAAANTGAAKGFGDTAAQVQTLVTSLSDAIAKGETFDSVWQELNGALFGTDQAGLAAHKAIDNVTSTLKANHDAWKGNSEAAQANRVVIGEAAEAAAKVADAKFQETGSVADANKVYDDYIGQLRKSMLAAGLSTKAVNTLLGEYSKMPASVSTDIKTPGLVTANGVAEGYRKVMNDIPESAYTVIKTPGLDSALSGVKILYTEIDKLHGKTVGVSVHFSSGLTAVENAVGGVYEHAAVGALRDAKVYSSVSSGARYAFAEPSTGGEAFIPKHGDMARSRSIADYTVSKWLGGQINWGGQQSGGSGGGGAVGVHFTADPVAAAAMQTMQIRAIVKDVGGGNVQATFGKR